MISLCFQDDQTFLEHMDLMFSSHGHYTSHKLADYHQRKTMKR